jgi:CPA1 family monovalent cation:H+ antiporter
VSGSIAAAIVFFGLKGLGTTGITPVHALIFGVIIAATDPIAVLALFRELGVTRRLSIIMEGESLFNDGLAVVLFGVVIGFVTGKQVGALAAVGQLVMEVAGGGLLGVLLGAAAARVMAQVDDHLVEITITTILAFGAYLLAEFLHISGVIAVIAAGLMTGNYGTRIAMSPTTKVAVSSFWEYAAFLVNSFVFLMIGLEVKLVNLKAAIWPVAVGVLAMLAGRAIAVLLSSALLKRIWRPIEPRHQGVLFWGGVRGALCMMLALALPKDMALRQLIMAMIFGAVLFTLLVQGLSMKPILCRLGLAGIDKERKSYELLKGSIVANERALDELKRLGQEGLVARANQRRMEKVLTERLEGLHRELDTVYEDDLRMARQERIAARKRLIHAEKDGLKEAFLDGLISEEVFRELVRDVDTRFVTLEALSAKDEGERDEE